MINSRRTRTNGLQFSFNQKITATKRKPYRKRVHAVRPAATVTTLSWNNSDTSVEEKCHCGRERRIYRWADIEREKERERDKGGERGRVREEREMIGGWNILCILSLYRACVIFRIPNIHQSHFVSPRRQGGLMKTLLSAAQMQTRSRRRPTYIRSLLSRTRDGRTLFCDRARTVQDTSAAALPTRWTVICHHMCTNQEIWRGGGERWEWERLGD